MTHGFFTFSLMFPSKILKSIERARGNPGYGHADSIMQNAWPSPSLEPHRAHRAAAVYTTAAPRARASATRLQPEELGHARPSLGFPAFYYSINEVQTSSKSLATYTSCLSDLVLT